MRKIQQLCVAGVFTLVLATSASGGQIDTGGKTAPPPPPPASASGPTSSEIPSDAKDDVGYEYQLMEDIALNLLRTMLSIF